MRGVLRVARLNLSMPTFEALQSELANDELLERLRKADSDAAKVSVFGEIACLTIMQMMLVFVTAVVLRFLLLDLG